jgi:hypothetical protein
MEEYLDRHFCRARDRCGHCGAIVGGGLGPWTLDLGSWRLPREDGGAGGIVGLGLGFWWGA